MERVKACHAACVTCAARTRDSDLGFSCDPSKLGTANRKSSTTIRRRFVFGRTHTTGFTKPPANCPNPPEGRVNTTLSPEAILRKRLRR